MSRRTVALNQTTSLRESVSLLNNRAVAALWTGSNTPLSPPKNSKPNFIIKWGPPASGKTQSLKGLIAQLGSPLNSYINFSVDDPIEKASYFRNQSLRIANNYFKNLTKNENTLVQKLNRVTNANTEPFKRVYSRVRYAANNKGRSFGNKLNDLLFDAIDKRLNITFETTGSSKSVWDIPAWPGWIWTKYPNLSSIYNVVIMFPLAPFETTWERYRRRAVQMYLKREGFRFAASKRQLLDAYLTSYMGFIRNLSSVQRMAKVSRVIVAPHRGSPLEWKPGATLMKSRAGLRTRNRQVMLDLVNKYVDHILNKNFNV